MDDNHSAANASGITLDPAELLNPQRNEELLNDILHNSSTPASRVIGLDKEIDSQIKRLVGLRTLRNSMLPIFTLPVEILSRIIFEYAAASDTLYDLKWMRVMEVCRHFRDASQPNPLLWSYIAAPLREYSTSYNLNRIKAQLTRSGIHPLSVKVHLNSDYFLSILSQESRYFILNPQRLASLHVEGPAANVIPWLKSTETSEFPLLTQLTVKARELNGVDSVEALPLMLPDLFVSGKAPRLRSLTLDNVMINLDLVHDLSSLSMLYDLRNGLSYGPSLTFSGIISCLSRSPALTKVTLFLPHWSSVGHVQLSQVSLLNVERLEIRGDVIDCSAFLSSIQMPSSASIRLYPYGLVDGTSSRQLMLRIREHTRGYVHKPPGLAIRTLMIEADNHHMKMNVHTDPGMFEPWTSLGYYLELNCHAEREVHRRQIISRFVNALPTTTLTHLDMRACYDFLSISTWKVLLRLPSIHFIAVQAGQSHFVALSSALVALAQDRQHLRTIQHIYIDGRMLQHKEEAVRIGEDGIRLLKQFLVMRLPHLNTLELTACWKLSTTEGYTLKDLSKLVENLIHDGDRYDREEIQRSRREHREYLQATYSPEELNETFSYFFESESD